MKIRCTKKSEDNMDGEPDNLTVGKVYYRTDWDHDTLFRVVYDDAGEACWYPKEQFEEVSNE